MQSYLKRARDPISSISHFFGALFFSGGTALMAVKQIFTEGQLQTLLSSMVFGLSLVSLYSASAAYHFVTASRKAIGRLRRLDHAMIYVLIAGSYTPILLHYFTQPKGMWLTLTIWLIAALGIAIKMLWFGRFRLLSTIGYVVMGWYILLDVPALAAMEPVARGLLIAGGIFYTVGGVLYALKRPNFSEKFGHHELFHMFVLLGSLMHFLIVLIYIA